MAACAGSRSTSRRRSCARRARGSTCRSRWPCSRPRGRCRPRRSAGTRRSASSRSTGGCGRSAACSPRPRARGRRGSRGSCARRSRRRGGAGRGRAGAGAPPGGGGGLLARRVAAASARRARAVAAERLRAGRARISPTCAARSAPGGRSSSRPRAVTTCCSAGRRAPARRCSRGGCRGSCRRSPPDEALEVTRIHSVAGLLPPGRPLVSRAAVPRAAPHGVGGRRSSAAGSSPRPGEASLAHRGVLLPRRAGRVPAPRARGAAPAARGRRRSRSRGSAGEIVFPARFQLVGTMNLCPCGARGDPAAECSCSAAAARRVPRQALARAARPVRPRRRPCRGRARASSTARRARLGRGARARRRPRASVRGTSRCAGRARPNELLEPRGRAAAALGPRPRARRARGADDRALAGADEVGAGARRRGALVPLADGARDAVSDLVLAAFAAETGGHVVDEPRERRFERFRRAVRRAGLPRVAGGARAALRSARSEAEFPPLLRELHDPPPGLFLRGCGAGRAARRSRRSRSSARGPARRTARRSRACSAASWRRPGSSSSAASRAASTARRTAARSRPAGTTVAVLGCGIDRDYPAAHAELAARIARGRASSSPSTRRASSRRPGGSRPATGSSPGSRDGDGRRRGARAQRRADHRRLRARGGPRGLRRARRDHVGALGGDERAPAPGRDAAHRAGRRARGARASSAAPRCRPSSARRPARVLEALAREPSGDRRARPRDRPRRRRPSRRRSPSSSSPGRSPRRDGLYRGVRPQG